MNYLGAGAPQALVELLGDAVDLDGHAGVTKVEQSGKLVKRAGGVFGRKAMQRGVFGEPLDDLLVDELVDAQALAHLLQDQRMDRLAGEAAAIVMDRSVVCLGALDEFKRGLKLAEVA